MIFGRKQNKTKQLGLYKGFFLGNKFKDSVEALVSFEVSSYFTN